MAEICNAIDNSDFFCADVTTVNANVMFELGFAIARSKRVWLVRDESYADPKKEFEQLRILTTIGYAQYTNSEQIIRAFFKTQPSTSTEDTIFKQSIEPLLREEASATLLYLKSRHDTEASVLVTRVLEESKLTLTVDDPRESGVQPLYWYAQKVYSAIGTVAHLLNPAREGFRLHNARYALVSGIAYGLDVPLLMLVEHSDVLSLLDYRDILRYYTKPAEAAGLVSEWLEPITKDRKGSLPAQKRYSAALRLATELKEFHHQLGEYVAENEAERLSEYFLDTTAYQEEMSGSQRLFVGRKGTGKTANLLRGAAEANKDIRNLVCVIKPVGYEIEGLARLFSSYKERDFKGYVIESLWKFMLYTELARTAIEQIESRALWELAEKDAAALADLLGGQNGTLAGDFTVRLERAVDALAPISSATGVQRFRTGISEALHSGALAELRKVLKRVLAKKRQVFIFIDNLDKPWTRHADLNQLGDFLLGLLTAAVQVGEEFRHTDHNQPGVKVNIAIFLRSDIFARIAAVAREPDKLSHTRLLWDDPEMLLRIVEERYTASHGSYSTPSDMWDRYFVAEVAQMPIKRYLVSRILPRPRDIVYLVKAAVSSAVNRGHERVEEKDIVDAEKQYSQYAIDSIMVENGITVPQLQDVVLEFAGSDAVLKESAVKSKVLAAKLPVAVVDNVIQHLVSLTFLGQEVRPGEFVFTDDWKELRKNSIFAERLARDRGTERRYRIHPAFHAYLEIHG